MKQRVMLATAKRFILAKKFYIGSALLLGSGGLFMNLRYRHALSRIERECVRLEIDARRINKNIMGVTVNRMGYYGRVAEDIEILLNEIDRELVKVSMIPFFVRPLQEQRKKLLKLRMDKFGY